MAKDENLDIVVPSIRRASHKGDQPAQEEVDEGEEHGSGLLSERLDPTKALLTGLIKVSVPFMIPDRRPGPPCIRRCVDRDCRLSAAAIALADRDGARRSRER